MTSPLLTSKAQLIDYLRSGCKKRSQWRLGVEHEKFLFTQQNKRADYKNHIQPLLNDLVRDHQWAPLWDQDTIIGVQKQGASITLEPGGQFELSGAPLLTLKDIYQELTDHFSLLKPYLDTYHLTIVFKGYDDLTPLDDVPLMPKQRYGIMAPYMAKKGTLGKEMMFNTSTVQVNLDFESEEDMVKKFRVSVALQSIATALFANSRVSRGQQTYESYRRHIWTQTDPDRCGLPLFVFDEDMGFEKYVDFALSVPMYFIVRQGRYINMAGLSFKDFMEGKLSIDGQPTLDDWADHLTTIFTEVRLKTYLEMRGADAGDVPYLIALPAFWMGLLYHQPTLDQAYEWIQGWTKQTLQDMAFQATRYGVKALKEEALRALNLSQAGLQALEPASVNYLDCLYKRVN